MRFVESHVFAQPVRRRSTGGDENKREKSSYVTVPNIALESVPGGGGSENQPFHKQRNPTDMPLPHKSCGEGNHCCQGPWPPASQSLEERVT